MKMKKVALTEDIKTRKIKHASMAWLMKTNLHGDNVVIKQVSLQISSPCNHFCHVPFPFSDLAEGLSTHTDAADNISDWSHTLFHFYN